MKLLFLISGFLFVGLASVGVVIPGIPTTPFLLLAVFCFARSSKRFEDWLKGTKLYKNYAADFVNERTMTKKQKTRILLISNAMMLFAIIIVPPIWVKIVIFLALLTQLYVFLFRIPTKK